MKSKRLFFLLAAGLCFNACNNNSGNTKSEAAAGAEKAPPTFDFTQTDSLEFYYYPQPRNQKDFKTFLIRDSIFIESLAGNLAQPVVEKQACEHSVKMYLYKGGDVYKTVYAAVADSCNYLAYVVNGKPYYVPLDSLVKTGIDSLTKQR